MAGAPEQPRPGVEVIQEFSAASPTIIRPTLVPFVCGAAKEVIEVTLADGTLNASARQGLYSQLPKTISQTAFPSPRGNILEVDVEEETIKVFFLDGGALKQLERDPGDGFLVAWNQSTRAAIETLPIPGAGFALDGLTMVLAIDVTARLNTTRDVVITFAAASPGANLVATQVRDQINNAVGDTVASAVDVGAGAFRVLIGSNAFGARSSVTVRAGGSANTILGFNPSNEYRVEGSGFRAQDLQNNTTLSPWVEWTRGGYVVTDSGGVTTTSTTFPAITGITAGFGLIDQLGVFAATAAAALTFTGSGSIDLKVGDQLYADGVLPNGASIKKVESTRIKLGTVNAQLSVFNDSGHVISAVYDDSFVNTLFSAAPFSPRYAWYKAKNLLVNPAALPAILTGAIEGNPALQAIIESGTVTVPATLSGLTLIFTVTVDGVELADQTFTFSGPSFASVADIATAITDGTTDIVATDDGGKLKVATIKTGAGQSVRLKSASTALAALNFPTGSDITDTGKDVEFTDINALVKTVGNSAPFTNLATKTLKVNVSPDGGTTKTLRTHTFGAGPFATVAAVIADIQGDATFIADITPSASGTELVLTTKTGGVIGSSIAGHLRYIDIDATGTGINGAGLLGFVGGETDIGEDELAGKILKFKLNDRPKVYSVTLTSDSLIDAVVAINAAVGFTVATAGGALEDQLVLTSTLTGYASKVETVIDTTSLQASRAFGYGSTATSAVGSGRPDPDFALDITGSVVLGAEILRSPVTGQPFNPGEVDTYIQYRGLRRDVSPSALHPALLNIGSVPILQNVLNPLNTDNPLGFGMLLQILNAPTLNCTGMGVDEISGAAPYGTAVAYARVANFIEAEEIYAIAPLTHDESVAQIFKAHVDTMSSPTQKGERILFFNPLVPDRDVSDIVASGLSGNTTATANEFVLDNSPVSGLNTRGINTAADIPVATNLYVEIVVGNETRVYSVKNVNGVVLTLRTTFATGENADGFFSTTPLSDTLVNADWSLAIRGTLLVIPGSSPVLPDKQRIAETVAKKAAAYKDRRLYYVFPDTVKSAVGGLEEIMPAFYACAAYTGLIAAQPPQQGFTNFPLGGISGVVGSSDFFSTKQLDIIAGGGVFILIQDAQGAPITCRHQLSTNMTSIETRELSITKVVDFTAKFKRTGLRNFIGTFNITQPFLDTLSTVIHGMSQFLVEQGVLIGADLNNLIQDKTAPDTVLADETLDVPFPCNYIRLTLVI